MKSNSFKLLRWKSLFMISLFALSLGNLNIAEAAKFGKNKNRSSSDRLKYDGKTSGIGKEIGGAIGDKFGGRIGGKVGEKIGDKLEKKGNERAHDKWNNRDRRGTSWRVSLLPDDLDELEY